MIVIQEKLLKALHAALACGSETPTLLRPPAELNEAEDGFKIGVLDAAADCVTTRVRPAMESEADREAVELLG